MGRGLLHGEQRIGGDRQGNLFPGRRRHSDAGPQGPAAAGPALLQPDAEVTAAAGSPWRYWPGESWGLSGPPPRLPRRSITHVLPAPTPLRIDAAVAAVVITVVVVIWIRTADEDEAAVEEG